MMPTPAGRSPAWAWATGRRATCVDANAIPLLGWCHAGGGAGSVIQIGRIRDTDQQDP